MLYQNDNFDYEAIIQVKCADLELVQGKRLEAALVNVVGSKIKVVYLLVEGSWFAIQGEIESEILGIHKLNKAIDENKDANNWVGHLEALDQFVDYTISKVRHMGEAWNGHGFEFSFDDLPDKTLIFQSIYAGSRPEGFEDCLRIGVATYIFSHEINEHSGE